MKALQTGTVSVPQSPGSQAFALPAYASIRDWCRLTGVGRSRTYLLLSAGHLRARKIGTRTLIDVHHGIEWLDRQPIARIRPHGTSRRSA